MTPEPLNEAFKLKASAKVELRECLNCECEKGYKCIQRQDIKSAVLWLQATIEKDLKDANLYSKVVGGYIHKRIIEAFEDVK